MGAFLPFFMENISWFETASTNKSEMKKCANVATRAGMNAFNRKFGKLLQRDCRLPAYCKDQLLKSLNPHVKSNLQALRA